MKIVFLSNYYNHHQSFLSENLYSLTNGNYCFIETETMTDERLQLGWGLSEYPVFVKKLTKDNFNEIDTLINEADVVITGSAPEYLIKKRLRNKKLIFRYSERIFKNKRSRIEMFLIKIKYYFKHTRHQNLFMLCASAFTSADYAKAGAFKNKTYKWGYFPETRIYPDIDKIIEKKQNNRLLWVGRLIEWKHPELAIEVAEKLKKEGFCFNLDIIGTGALENKLKAQIELKNLGDCVHLRGAMTPEEVRTNMERAEIFLFTSDRNEGWGAVLNEAMNSACAVVAGHAIGSVPFLINNPNNGLIYKDGDFDDLYVKVKYLLLNSDKRKEISRQAYSTICNEWNATVAAERFIKLTENINASLYLQGPCSAAEILSDDWITNDEK